MMRLGIIGTGAMAQRMLASLAHRPQIRVTAIGSASPDRAKGLGGRIGAVGCSATDLAARGDVDAVYVATGNAGHAAAALSAIAAGKPVLVEKPLGVQLAEVTEVIGAAQAARVLVVENLWTLALPATRAMIAHPGGVGAGFAGAPDPRLLHMDFGYPVTPQTHPGLFGPDAGVLRDRAGYGLALALRLFGPVADLRCTLRIKDGCDVAALIALRHQSGDLSNLTVAFDALLPNRTTLSGPRGMITIAPSIGAETCATYTSPPPGPAQPRPSRLAAIPAFRALNRWRKAPAIRTHSYGADPYLPMLDHFTALIRDKAPESPLVPLSLSAEVQSLIERARSLGGMG